MDKNTGFKKIDLSKAGSENKVLPQKKEASFKKKKAFPKKLVFGLIGGLIVFILFLFFAVVMPVRNISVKAQEAIQTGRETAFAIKSQNLEESSKKLKESEEKITALQNSYKSLGWTKYIPFFGAYYKDGEHGLNASSELIKAGQIAVEEVIPYADLLGLSGGGNSFVDQPADKRIETAILTFSKVTPKLSIISEYLEKAKKEIDEINPDRYPAKIAGKEVRPKIEQGKELADQTISLFVDAQPFLEILPELVGVPDSKRYLVLFQNDKELRATGGFLTAYSIMNFDKGKMKMESSEDIYKLDERQKKRIAAPEEIKTYHKGVSYFYLRDSNLSPDFQKSMEMFEDLYKNIGSDPMKDFDGIIAVDTHVLVAVMNVLDGEIFIPEYNDKLTTKPDDRCDGCAQVIYELEEYADRPVGYFRGERKDILGRLLYYIMQKSLGVSPSQYWGNLTQALLKEINEKHIIAYMHDDKAQSAIESLNFAGKIKEFDGDYLHINDVNFAGAKSNMFVKHFITQDIEIDKSGKVVKTITINYKNPSPASNCGVGGLCLNGVLRNWLRIYVPEGSKLISFEGSETETVTKEDLGKTVFEGFLTVNPMGSAKVTVKYELPSTVTGKEYKTLIQKQPGTEGHEYTININGKQVDKFNLTIDKELKYKI